MADKVEILCTINWEYSDAATWVDKMLFERRYTNEFMKVYSEYTDVVNGGRWFEKLNARFEELYPGYFKDGEGRTDNELYDQWISEQCNKYILKDLNERHSDSNLEYFADYSRSALCARFKCKPKVEVGFSIKLLDKV